MRGKIAKVFVLFVCVCGLLLTIMLCVRPLKSDIEFVLFLENCVIGQMLIHKHECLLDTVLEW